MISRVGKRIKNAALLVKEAKEPGNVLLHYTTTSSSSSTAAAGSGAASVGTALLNENDASPPLPCDRSECRRSSADADADVAAAAN